MDFNKLNEMIPYCKGGKKHILTMHPYNGITLAMPGRHAEDTTPKGGDFVVMVDDEDKSWTRHQFTHADIFDDLNMRLLDNSLKVDDLMRLYLAVIQGADPEKFVELLSDFGRVGLVHPSTFLYAVQCLAVAEHRRYHQYEAKFGGRYLPFRFGTGIVEGLWTAMDATQIQRRGRPGVEQLERTKGMPTLTKELMK
jgi:hypothetical protein